MIDSNLVEDVNMVDITMNQSAAGDLVIIQLVSEAPLTKSTIAGILNSISERLTEVENEQQRVESTAGPEPVTTLADALTEGFNEADSDNSAGS